MSDFYIEVLFLDTNGIREISNSKINLKNSCHQCGDLTVSNIVFHGDYLQMDIWSANLEGKYGFNEKYFFPERYGCKINEPFWFCPYGGIHAETDSEDLPLGALYTLTGSWACIGFDHGPVSYYTHDYERDISTCNSSFFIIQTSRHPITLNNTLAHLGLTDSYSYTSELYQQAIQSFYKSVRINSFNELMHYIDSSAETYNNTQKMVQNTVVYGEGFTSNKKPFKKGRILFEESMTLHAAMKYGRDIHTAVLNFANPVEPGGGILRGACAQEESICRSSNLYKSLISANAKTYYSINNAVLKENQFNSMFLGTDMVIYSPGVMRLKENRFDHNNMEVYVPTVSFDVLTCAAPFFSGSGYILPNGDLGYLFERRIKNIFEVCIENDVSTLVLGAFGCGAFHNPPEIVANAFKKVLSDERYKNAFDTVVFAVKKSKDNCPNVDIFKRTFQYY